MFTGQPKYLNRIAALLTGCIFVIAGCENDPGVIADMYKKKVGVEEGFEIVSYLSQDGYTKAKLVAPYMLRYQADSTYLEFPRTLHVDFFDSTSARESYMDADYAKYFEYERKVLLRDSVVVINMKTGDTLRTQKLWWDQNKSEFTTDDTAYIFQRDKVIIADKGLRADQNLKNINFFRSRGVLSVPKDDSTSTSTDSLSMSPIDSARHARPPLPIKKDSTN
jgi:LPS export ABC transporter protein LptC